MEEAKKQNNIEAITVKALADVNEDSNPGQIDDDWIANFFDKCRLVSDEQMQQLWSKILSSEANSPGRFSKRTVNLLAGLDKDEAQLFSNVCRFSFDFGGPTPLIYDATNELYTQAGVNFATLTHLDSVSLISFAGVAGFVKSGFNPKGFATYFDQTVWIEFRNAEDYRLDIGRVILTQPGFQLAPFAGARAVDGFVDYV